MKTITIILILFSIQLISEETTVLELETSHWGEKKLKNSNFPKKVYIKDFTVNYQLLINWVETRQGGRQFGGGVKGDATAQLMLGVASLTESDLIILTDSLYSNFIQKLQDQGFDVLNSSELAKSETLEKYDLVSINSPEKNDYPGVLVFKPSQEKFYKRRKKKYFDMFARSAALNHPHKIAEELNIGVINVSLNVNLFEDSESGFMKAVTRLGGNANLEAKTNLKIDKNSIISFSYPESNFVYKPDEDIQIDGVVEEKEYEAYQRADSDTWGTDYGIYGTRSVLTIYSADNLSFSNFQEIKCEPGAYKNGVFSKSSLFFQNVAKNMIQNY